MPPGHANDFESSNQTGALGLIDLRAARADPDRVRAALARKGGAEAFDALLAADGRWRALVPEIDELRARRAVKPQRVG